MNRKFYINMSQKHELTRQFKDNINLLIFHRTNNKAVQIVEFDDEEIKEQFTYNYNIVLHCLGIPENHPYHHRHMLKEILAEDTIEDYKAIYSNNIDKETDKAYYIKGLEAWIPKSQTLLKGNILYIKKWIFFKNL